MRTMSDPQPLQLASTPAHRQNSTYTKSSNSNKDKNNKIWTAARCHRLLRQLHTRIEALRKSTQEARRESSKQGTKRPSIDERQSNCCAPKRIRYTYSRRRQPLSSIPAKEISNASNTLSTPPRSFRPMGEMKPCQRSPVDSRIDLTTPFLQKIRDQPASPHDSENPSTFEEAQSSKISKRLAEDLRSIRQVISEDKFKIYEGIYEWLDNLLRLTETITPQAHSKSLLGICLRRIPACIAEIENWERQAAEGKGERSMCNPFQASRDIYGQLEAFGSVKAGWQPFKTVLRAHAILILQRTVAEKLLEPEFIGKLAQLCIRHGYMDEAVKLILSVEEAFPAPRSATSTLPENSRLQLLLSVVCTPGGSKTPGAAFGCLAELVRNRTLPIDWLSTKAFRPVWTSCLESMTGCKQKPLQTDFMTTALRHMVLNTTKGPGDEKWAKQGVREQTLISMVAGVTAVAVTMGGDHGEANACFGKDMTQRKPIARRFLHTLDSCISLICNQSAKRANKSAGHEGLFVLVLARYLAMTGGMGADSATMRNAQKECEEIVTSLGTITIQEQYRKTLSLVCAIARYRGRACAVSCHDMLLAICKQLEELWFPDWFRRGLKTDGAFLLAQGSRNLKDVAFAERLAATIGQDPETASTGISLMFAGWKWEEGISEWVEEENTSKCGRRAAARIPPSSSHSPTVSPPSSLSASTSSIRALASSPPVSSRIRQGVESKTQYQHRQSFGDQSKGTSKGSASKSKVIRSGDGSDGDAVISNSQSNGNGNDKGNGNSESTKNRAKHDQGHGLGQNATEKMRGGRTHGQITGRHNARFRVDEDTAATTLTSDELSGGITSSQWENGLRYTQTPRIIRGWSHWSRGINPRLGALSIPGGAVLDAGSPDWEDELS